MDSDNFFPAIISAARIVGLGEYAVKAIEASGIRLHQQGVVKEPNSITWVTEKTKSVREKIVGWGGEFSGRLDMESTAEEGTEPFGKAGLSLRSFVGGVGGQVFATLQKGATAITLLILDAQGRSDFVQVLGGNATKNIKCIAGLVQNNGTIIYGTGYTVERTGVGQYTITLAEGMPAGFAVTGSDAQNAGRVFSYTTLSNSRFSVTMRNQAAGFTTEDIAFAFILMGAA